MTGSTQLFTTMPIKDLAQKSVCDGHVFLMIGEKKFYLLKPGILVDPQFIKKYAASQSTFLFEQVSDNVVKETFKNYFKELRYLKFERDLKEKCFEIVKYFYEVYSGPEHLMSFAMACYEEFCLISFEDQIKMHETDMHLFRKSLYSAAFSVLFGMTNDYFHYLMLKDFYNLTFSLDIGLCDSNYSYYVAEACNAENREPGTGKYYLMKEKASELEVEVYFKHPEKSYSFIKEKAILNHPELAEIVLYQHELSSGRGFPRGVSKGQTSTWESIVILASSIVEISSEYNFENDVLNYLILRKMDKLKDLPVYKVYTKLRLTFNHFKILKETGS